MKKMFQKIADMTNPQYLIIIGSVITLFGTYLAYSKEQKDSEKTENKISETLVLTKQVHDLTSIIDSNQFELKEKQIQIKELQDKNFQLSQRISSNALEIVDYVSSKDSYVYITLTKIDTEKDFANFIIQGAGKHPIKVYDIRIADLNGFNSNPYWRHFELTAFPGYATLIAAKIPVDLSKPLSWNIFFETSNGHLCQELRSKVGSKKMLYSNKIFSMDNTEKVLFEQTDKDFYKN
jgi:hypothetical protein